MEQGSASVQIVEIRAPRDRNRLLGHYDPARRVLRLFHRGETVTIKLPPSRNEDEPVDVRQNVE